MPYPESLKALIKKVDETRSARVARKKSGEEVPFMSLEERAEILKKFHPDAKDEGRREIKVGPSKGYRIAHEMVDLLEAKSRVDPAKIDLSKVEYETDVLVLGGGGAGSAAALLAQEQGAKVIIATKLRHGDANTMMAEGGIQAATKGDKDSPYCHYLDIVGGGHFKNVPKLVETLVTDAPDVIRWLLALGCNFDKFDDGRLKTLHGGGTSRKRMHSAADITGAEVMRTVRDEVRNRSKDIAILEFSSAVELILNEHGHCQGAVLYNMETQEYFNVKAKAVVMATGGSGRLHIQNFMTTNHYGATADGVVLGYRAGVQICFLHTVQYHPTGVVFPEQAEGVPTPSGRFGVWLDSPMIETLRGEGYVEKNFPGKFILYKRFEIDISKEPMLVYPTLHYQNGGLVFKEDGTTSLPGLFVAGEVGGGTHGENRLMGNSLLDIMVYGRIAGRNAAEYALNAVREGALSLDHVVKYNKELADSGADEGRVAPMLLPDYTLEHVKERQLTTHYVGTLR